jgi:hypothetical protein
MTHRSPLTISPRPDRHDRAHDCASARPPRRRLLLSLLALFTAGSTLGCTVKSEFMTDVAPQPIHGAVGMATVVFIRPSAQASEIRTTILDERGTFLGDSLPESHFAALVTPGQHIFIAWAENTDALKATLEAGKVYFVEVASRMGAEAPSARMHLLALSPRAANWAKVDKWLLETKELIANQEAGQRDLASHQDDVKERIRRANDALASYNEDELAARTLRPEDGR